MKRILTAIFIIVLLGCAVWYFSGRTDVSVASDEQKVRVLVQDFGARLKQVSLLDDQNVVSVMEENYGAFLSPTLLARWQSNPENALGRLTSSPWPDRIDIRSIEKLSDTSFRVEAEIIEVTNEGGGIGEAPTEAARRPVTFTVENIKGDWLITDAILGAYVGAGNWVLLPLTSQNIQFMYPNPLQTTYITPQEWPPRVEIVVNKFSCMEGPITAADGSLKTLEKHMVGDRVYCVSLSSEGAAGSTYRNYEYSTDQGSRVVRIYFTLRFPQCLNYDEPKQSACKAEQESFDINGLVDRIASSIQKI